MTWRPIFYQRGNRLFIYNLYALTTSSAEKSVSFEENHYYWQFYEVTTKWKVFETNEALKKSESNFLNDSNRLSVQFWDFSW